MKAGTVVLFTLFLPVLAGPPVEAAEWSAHGPPFWHDARYFGDEETLFETFDNFLDKELNEVNEDDEDEDWQPISRRFIDFLSKFSRRFKDFDLDDFPNFDEYVRKRMRNREVRAMMRAKDMKLRRLNMRLEKRLEGMKGMTQWMTQKSLREMKKQMKMEIKMNEEWREKRREMKRLEKLKMNEMNEKLKEMKVQEEEEEEEVQMMPLHLQTKGAKTGQRSIMLGLSTLTIFSGLAFLIFWILERQNKFSRTNIKG